MPLSADIKPLPTLLRMESHSSALLSAISLEREPTERLNLLYIMTSNSKPGVPRRCFSGYTQLRFEDKDFMVMQGYDEMLRVAYGDYMKLPPEDSRYSHNPASKIVFPPHIKEV